MWTTPKTWAVGDFLTASDMNTYVRDNTATLNPTPSSSPPGSPVDGDYWIYDGGDYYWRFLYDSGETTYKWKFVGGAAAEAKISTDETFTDDSALHDATTAGPTVTVPRAGDYEVDGNANMYYASQSAGSFRPIGAPITASSGTWDGSGTTGSSMGPQQVTTGGIGVQNVINDVIRGMSASGTLKMQYAAQADTGTAHVRARVLRVRPIRVI